MAIKEAFVSKLEF